MSRPFLQPTQPLVMGPDHFHSAPSFSSFLQTISALQSCVQTTYTAPQTSYPVSRPFIQPTQPLVMGPDHFHSPPSFSSFVQIISAPYPVSSPVSRPFLQPLKPPILCPDHFCSPPSLQSCVHTISTAFQTSHSVSRPFLQSSKPPVLCPDHFSSPHGFLSCENWNLPWGEVFIPLKLSYSWVN